MVVGAQGWEWVERGAGVGWEEGGPGVGMPRAAGMVTGTGRWEITSLATNTKQRANRK